MLSLHLKRRRALTAVFSLAIILPVMAFAIQKMLAINGVFAIDYTMPAGFNDQVFYNCIVEQFKTQYPSETIPDSGLTDQQLAKMKKLACNGSSYETKISDATGINKLTDLTYLDLEWNELTSINLSSNTKLESLYLMNNNLTSLDVTSLPSLKIMKVNNNSLETLNVSNKSNLRELEAMTNELISLNASNNPSLTTLMLDSNTLISLNVMNDTALKTLSIYSNLIETLDLSTNPDLTTFIASFNHFSSLDFSHNPNLKDLRLSSNKLTSIDLSNLTQLEAFYAVFNKITSINLSNNPNLKNVELGSNLLTSLNASANTSLQTLKVDENQISSLILPNTATLTSLEINENNITSLDVSPYVNMTNLVASDNNITSLNLSNNTALTTLNVYNNQMTGLDIAANTALRNFAADNIPILMDIDVLEDGSGFSLANLKFIKSNQTIPNTDTYTYTKGTKILTITDPDTYTGTAQITSGITGSSYKVILPMLLDYDAGEGTGQPDAEACYALTAGGCRVDIPDTEPTRDGYEFLGWANSASGTTADYLAGQSVVMNDAWVKTLHAVWSPIHTLTYNVNGGQGTYAAQTCYSDTDASQPCSLTIAATEPTRDNYVFLGWATDASATSGGHQAGSSISINSDVELRALWGVKRTLSYDTNGGTGTFNTQTCHANNTTATTCNIVLSNERPTRDGYDFLGWANNQSAETADYAAGQSIAFNTNTKTIYAVWKVTSSQGPTITPSDDVYKNGNNTGITFKPATNMSAPSKVEVDGATLTDGTQYTVDPTTGAVTFLPAFLDTLNNGSHTVTITWADGKTSSSTFVTYGKGTDEDTGPAITPSNPAHENGSGESITVTPGENQGAPAGVYVDGKKVDKQFYTVDETTGAVTFSPEYLDSLSDGEHIVRIVWKDGTTSSTLIKTMGNSDRIIPVPNTGAEGNEEPTSNSHMTITAIGGCIAVVITISMFIVKWIRIKH
ncbi:InlB B-repeat-containing protein [Candidatus Saccharibacteria bacterium]|nr:InlB B-repeat-containing protein [Candidatus Saccharibacteria bacterium]